MVKNPKHELVINPFFVPEEVFTFENYPNAVSDMLNVKVELPSTQEVTIALMDIDGNVVRQIYQGEIGSEQEVIIQEQLDDLDNGLYFLLMWTKGQMLVRKVIVKH